VADGEQVVDNLETLGEFGGGVVFEEGEDGYNAVGRDVDLGVECQ
jgi:hypothetical protein